MDASMIEVLHHVCLIAEDRCFEIAIPGDLWAMHGVGRITLLWTMPNACNIFVDLNAAVGD